MKEPRRPELPAPQPITYPDTSALKRPITMPRSHAKIVIIFLVAAIVIGAAMLHKVVDTIYLQPARTSEAIAANIARESALDAPVLTDIIQLGDETIQSNIEGSGANVVNTTPENGDPEFRLTKFPADVSPDEGLAKLENGIGGLNALDASMILPGYWVLSVNRAEYVDARLHYVDFSVETLQDAIQNAIVSQGFDSGEIGEAGVDEAGNTFQQGTIEANGKTYTWRVSVLPLKDIYEIRGLPDNAVYVGIRMSE